MEGKLDVSVSHKVDLYSAKAKAKFFELRSLVYAVARDNDLGTIVETVKWGQPSYLSKHGSTVRIDWLSEDPENLGVFFNCNTSLVETFKEVFGNQLVYNGNRVVVVAIDNPVPPELSACFFMALNYHKLKRQPLLGA